MDQPDHGALSAFDSAPVWLNSEPLTAEGLRGSAVLVDVWTYSCINWLRTLPYVRAWHERYRDRGLVVVGVHAPEFGFEHELDNVRRAAGELDVGYPIVIDNDFVIKREKFAIASDADIRNEDGAVITEIACDIFSLSYGTGFCVEDFVVASESVKLKDKNDKNCQNELHNFSPTASKRSG